MNHTVNQQLIFQHFAGQDTPLQRKLIEQWLAEPANQERYFEWLEAWERQNLQFITEEETQLQASLAQIDQFSTLPEAPDTVQPLPRPASRFPFRWLAAAAVSLLIGAGLWQLSKPLILYRTLETGYGEVRREVLPDGSVVTLNAHSSLQLPRFGFGTQGREVLLKGEADFAVTHLPGNQRFVVRTQQGLDVVVLGTEFTVYARQKARVVLNRGKVRIDYHAAQPRQLTMKPGDLVELDTKGRLSLARTERPEIHAAWKEHRFVFEETSMVEIARMLEENYGLQVSIQGEKLPSRTVSGSFRARTADEMLRVISELLEINYNRQNNHVTLFE